MRDMLRSRLEREREALPGFLPGFLRAPSAHPPGDTRPAATHAAFDHLPNLLASVPGTRPGPHLVLNDHIDVSPRWTARAGPAGARAGGSTAAARRT
ncbi:MAG: hypothetical protein K2X11_20495 [Acetobacteraceae bacterium]|nr:hypothetical protein [Acetobacteraceae bacterium]